ncbi:MULTISPECIES: type II toxin-antitoxin system ParD family antitoxin [Leptolyngbya]|uniref:type II toxin-antitoxin system ParD family antitoxin n=1 Tax=Leptolyngbya TaxID=47251 RepID=UPI001687F89C|nr:MULTISPECIES: type II toxin-antitoxin system ParD family antitoxin [unclassified Leptolyngbya]MBD1856262.1 type II toxin-antitoxin system ParD family antitoxin [Leptolyngbya sp. FACHB-1624]MBN8560265.1 type II toxin-antitoxin system ParD family antitoxin [Leptolyngbya sp. UWPOB_LEPTO1]
MNMTLNPDNERFIQTQIQTGRFASAEEVINAALEVFAEREKRLTDLRQKIQSGTEQLRNGEGVDGEAVFERLQARIQQQSSSES